MSKREWVRISTFVTVALGLAACSSSSSAPATSDTTDAGTAEAAAVFSCTGKTGPTGDNDITFMSNEGIERTAHLHVPDGYDPSVGTMLVLNLHGLTSNGTQQKALTHMSTVSDERNFLVVYPEGLKSDATMQTSWNAGFCCGVNAHDDMGYLQDLIAHIEDDYCVDPKKVFSTGMSNGAMMSYRLGCELADTIAAIAPVAGDITIKLSGCTPSRPISVLAFHGTADPLVPYGGGLDGATHSITFPPVATSVGTFRMADGCPDTPMNVYAQGDASCDSWSPGTDNTEVELCTIDGGGHSWPGGLDAGYGKTSTDIDASRVIIDFFEKHPMP